MNVGHAYLLLHSMETFANCYFPKLIAICCMFVYAALICTLKTDSKPYSNITLCMENRELWLAPLPPIKAHQVLPVLLKFSNLQMNSLNSHHFEFFSNYGTGCLRQFLEYFCLEAVSKGCFSSMGKAQHSSPYNTHTPWEQIRNHHWHWVGERGGQSDECGTTRQCLTKLTPLSSLV